MSPACPTLSALAAAVLDGSQPPDHALGEALDQVATHDAALGCFREVTAESARSAASDLAPRITAEDQDNSSVTVPYPDDRSLNFALFVYNGVPAYTASTRSVLGAGCRHSWPIHCHAAQ